MAKNRKVLDSLWGGSAGSGKQTHGKTSSVDNDYVNQFISDASSYMDTIDEIVNGISYRTARGTSYTQSRISEDLQERAERVIAYLDENPDQFDAGQSKALRSQIEHFRDTAIRGKQAVQEARDYYSQWDTEDAYNRAMQENSWAQKYQGKGYQELVPLLEGMEDGEKKTWLKDYTDYVDYNERINMDLESANQEIQALQDQLNRARNLEENYNEYRNSPLLMLTQGDTWHDLESRYDAFNEKYGGIEQLQADIDRKRQRMAEGKQTQDSIRQEAEYEQWKQNVRDPKLVQQELDKINQALSLNQQAIREANRGSTQQDMAMRADADAGRQALEQQRAALEQELQYGRMREYAALMQRPDFEKNSQYIPTGDGMAIRDNATGQMVNPGFGDIEYDYVNKNPKAEAYQGSLDSAQGLAQMGLDRSWLLQLTEDEVKVYNYLYHTEGRDTAREYLQTMRSELNRRQRVSEEMKWAQYAQEHPVLASAASVALAPMKAGGFVGQVIDRAVDGRIDQNASYNRASHVSTAIRDQVTQQIQQNGKWGQVGAFGYQTAMSMGDFLMNGVAGGGLFGVPGVTMAIMGSGAAADTVISAKDRGIGDAQAFGLGVVAGLAEAMTERFSLEALLDADLLKNGIGVYVLKNSLTEGSEEVASSIINLVADVAAAKEKSEWQQAIRGYQDMGFSEGEAFAKAMADQAASMGMDFLGGVISGGVMSGATSAQYKASTAKTGRAMGRGLMDSETVQNLLNKGANAERGSAANAVVARLQKKVDAGKQLNAYEKGQLYQSNPQAVGEAVFNQGSVQLADPMVKGIDSKHEDWQQAQRLASITGRDIRFYNGDPDQDGFYDRKTGEIFINVDRASEHQAAYIFSHELIHSTEMGDAYADLKNHIRDKLISEGRDWNLMMRRKAEAYANAGHALNNDADIEAEVIAQYVQDNLLTNEQELFDLFWAEPTIGQKILNWFDKLLAKYGKNDNSKERLFAYEARQKVLRAWESSNQVRKQPEQRDHREAPKTTGETQYSPENLTYLDRMYREQYDRGDITEEEYDEYLAWREHEAAVEEGAEELGRQYSIHSDYAQEIDQWNRAGRYAGETFTLGTTGDVLQGLGALESDIYMQGDKINQILSDHPEMTLEEIKKIPQILEDPILILKSRNVGRGRSANTRMVVFGSIRVQNGMPVLTVLDLRPVENNLVIADMQKVSSAYTKDQNPVGFVRDSEVLYADKKRTAKLLRTIGFQMPIELQQSGYIGSITYDGQRVNISGEKFRNVTREAESRAERQYSFAGPKAKTADQSKLQQAKQMESDGVANETIRQQTGWFRGMDGKWRFEIDDSTMKYHRNGDALFSEMHPEYARHQELMQKWLYGELDGKEEIEFRELDEVWGREHQRLSDRVRRGNATLQNMLNHDKLFEAYPELRGAKVIFENMDDGKRGQYDPNTNTITLSNTLRNAPQETLLHEVQHAIQSMENFTGGASIEYWKEKRRDIVETIAGARKNLDLWLADIGYPEVNKQSLLKVSRREKTLEQHWKDMKEFKEKSEFARQIAACEAEIAEFQKQYDEITNGMTAYEQYENTAGEIEARDTANRWKFGLDEEGRKNTPPDLGGERTVFAEGDARSFSIVDIEGEKDNYGAGVLLDTNIFDGVRTRDWGTVLSRFVYQNLAGAEMTVYDEDGNAETIYLAREYDRVRKDGAKNSHKVLDKLAGYRGNEVRARAIVQLSEVLETSRYENSTDEHNHQWMDEKGWIFRKAYLQTMDGNIYEATLNIADGRDHKTLYEVNKVHWIDKKETSASIPSTDKSQRSRYQGHEMGGAQSEVTNNNLADNASDVNHQYSLNTSTVSKRDVARDLRAILSRGGDPRELQQYVSRLEQNSGRVEQNGENRYQTGANRNSTAREILHSAHHNGQSVEEYLRWNPEQYERDGKWRPEALEAMRMEQGGGRQYSLNEEAGQQENAESQAHGISRENLPIKAQNYLRRAESTLLNRIGEALSVPRYARYQNLRSIIQEISDIYMQEGTIPDERMDELFDKSYAAGIITDAEFYNQYKEIKDHLRTYGMTLSERDKSNIADYNDFRKRAFGTLRIVDQGGVPVDTAYQELQTMAPELFPDNITHPADQLVRMYDVGQSIVVSQKSLDEYYGSSEAERKESRKWARNDFDAAVGDAIRDLKLVKRYAEEHSEEVEVRKILTTEDAEKAFEELKQLRRNVDKVRAKNLLSESDEILLGRMLKGEIGPQHLNPNEDNVKGITALYEAKLAYESQCEVLAAYKRSVRAKRLQEADRLLETARTWKDKKAGILYARETMRRNILDIVPDRKVAEEIAETYFESVHISEAKSTRFKNDYRDRVRALKLSTKVMKGNLVSEAHAVQLLGEAMDNIRVIENSRGRMWTRDGKTLSEWRAVVDDLWMNNTGLDRQKIEHAVQEFRKIYDELFQQMNRVRVENGYEPVNYRQGYFPHFQPGGDGIMAFFGKAMGINTQVDSLPTSINGLTHTFKPGIQWFGNAQERLGFNTAYDAVEGFDKYIEGVASVIFQTENIQRLRALATQARYRTTDEGIRKQVDFIRMDNRLTEEEKQTQINSIYEHGKFSLSNFVAELDEYTNLLANKKSKYDRTMESLIGRRAYMLMKNWENRVGANMIAGNISSAVTNFIPLTQAGAQLDRGMILKGMYDTLKNMKQGDGIVGLSDFLTNRRGSDVLKQTWVQKTSGILGTPMELIDNFTSESIVRAAYLQNLKRGLSENEAMHQADIFASGLMADRSKGAMPTLFESRNPLFKAFTQFQLEVNNQFSEIFKDLPRNHREKGLAILALILLKYFLGAWIYNDLFEKVIGRRPALDPIDMLNQTVGDLTGYEIPNLFDMASDLVHGEDISFETEKVGIGEAGSNLATSVLSELPFSAGLNMFGVETDGGRLPAASAVPDFSAIWQAATDGELTGDQRWKKLQDELNKLAYVLPPFGGGQISKSYKGIKAYLEGGSYSLDKAGNEILQYPVYKDDPDDAFWSLVRAAFLGKNSLPEAQDWVENGYDSLDQYETVVYKDLLDCGVKDRDAYDLVNQLRKLDETETESGPRRAEGRRILAKSDISAEGKAAAFYGMVATKTEREWMDELVDAGADQADTMAFVSNLYDTEKLKGIEKKQEQLRAFLDAPLTEEEKKVAVGFIMDTAMETESGNPTQYAKFLTAISTGLTVDKYMEIRATETDVEDYLELNDIGIKGEKAADLAIAIDSLETAEGYDSVTWIQRSRTIVDSGLTEQEQMAALQTVMYESTYEKVEVGHNCGMNVKSYIDLKSIMPEFDANGNGSYSQQETEDAINALAGDDNPLFALTGTTPNGYTLTDREKAILWQLQNKSWKPKRNPFDREVGQMVYDILTAEDPEDAAATVESGMGADLADLLSLMK